MKSVKGINHDYNDTDMNNEMLRSIVAESNDFEVEEEETEKQKPKKNSTSKRKREEKSDEEIAQTVEYYMAMFEIACEDDIILNKESKPCINKLKFLPNLIEILSKKPLQKAFVDHGIFTLLKNWLEPLPDGSLPNIDIRRGILLILTDKFQFDLNDHTTKEQLKKSGLGKVIMFLSKSDEETLSNQKLAKDLVYKWSRGIYNISTRFEDVRPICSEMVNKRPCIRKSKAIVAKDDEPKAEVYKFSSGDQKLRQTYGMLHAQLPEPTLMTFVIAPPSNVVKTKRTVENEHRTNIMKTLRKIKVQNRALRRVNYAC